MAAEPMPATGTATKKTASKKAVKRTDKSAEKATDKQADKSTEQSETSFGDTKGDRKKASKASKKAAAMPSPMKQKSKGGKQAYPPPSEDDSLENSSLDIDREDFDDDDDDDDDDMDDDDDEPPLSIGSPFPSFDLPDQDGRRVQSSSLKGQSYVVYFYPKDDTSGCTKQACDFRDSLPAFEDASVRVIGVSPDQPESHVKFRKKYNLPFTLLSDVQRELSKKAGVWQLKKLYGRESMGIVRTTFLVGSDGKIKKIWRNVRVAGHIPDVLAASNA
jgi:peroxiredoxin Q/BCP